MTGQDKMTNVRLHNTHIHIISSSHDVEKIDMVSDFFSYDRIPTWSLVLYIGTLFKCIFNDHLIGFIENIFSFKKFICFIVLNGGSVPDRLFTVSTQSINCKLFKCSFLCLLRINPKLSARLSN